MQALEEAKASKAQIEEERQRGQQRIDDENARHIKVQCTDWFKQTNMLCHKLHTSCNVYRKSVAPSVNSLQQRSVMEEPSTSI